MFRLNQNYILDGRPPPIPIEKLQLKPVNISEPDASRLSGRLISGSCSQRSSSGLAKSSRQSPTGSARSYCHGESVSGISPVVSSRKPSLTLSERRAIEERRMEIESVRGL